MKAPDETGINKDYSEKAWIATAGKRCTDTWENVRLAKKLTRIRETRALSCYITTLYILSAS